MNQQAADDRVVTAREYLIDWFGHGQNFYDATGTDGLDNFEAD